MSSTSSIFKSRERKEEDLPKGGEKVMILVLFLGKSNISGWPYHHFDTGKHMEKVKENIRKLELKEFEFFGFKSVENLRDIWNSYSLMEEADGQIIVPITAEFAALGPDLGKMLELNTPSIIYTIPFSVYYDGYACVKHSGGRVCVVASSNPNDLIEPLVAIKTISKLRKTRLLVVRDILPDYTKIDKALIDPARWKGPAYCRKVKSEFGVQLSFAESEELLKCWEEVNMSDVKEDMTSFTKEQFKEPDVQDVEKAVRMYHALRLLMIRKRCNGVTVDCLSYIREKRMPVSPCYAISRMLKEGIVTGCEADVESVICLAINLFLTDTPGFQGDPVIDRGNNQVIIAHCTASPRMCSTNVEVEDCPFIFRTHNESHADVGIQVKMPVGKPCTIFKVFKTGSTKYVGVPVVQTSVGEEKYHLVCSESETVEPIVEDWEWGCRTKCAIKLSKEKMDAFEDNFFGHHRIVVYGHHKRKLKILCQLLGLQFHSEMFLKQKK